jgi:hypothetical protein
MNTVVVSNPPPLLSRPALSIGLAFLLMGLGYAFPLPLVSHAPARMWAGQMAPEILNLYALTAWMGQAHFFYAFRGQAKALARNPKRTGIFSVLVALVLVALIETRMILGVGLFSALVWIYFIGHFAKAERVFQSSQSGQRPVPLAYYQPVLAFAWLSLVLFNVGHLDIRPWLLLGIYAGPGNPGPLPRWVAGSFVRKWALHRARAFPVGRMSCLGNLRTLHVAGFSRRRLRLSHRRSKLLPLSRQLFLRTRSQP